MITINHLPVEILEMLATYEDIEQQDGAALLAVPTLLHHGLTHSLTHSFS